MRTVAKISVLDFGVFFDTRISIAFWIGFVASALAGVLLLMVLHMRWKLLKQARRRKQFRQNAKLNLIQLLAGEVLELPVLGLRDLPDFLFVWLHFQELLRGESHTLLNQALVASHLHVSIHLLLQSSWVMNLLGSHCWFCLEITRP